MGTEFDLLDIALAHERICGVGIAERFDVAIALRNSFDVAVEEGIIEESFAGGVDDEGDDEAIFDLDDDDHAGDVVITFRGRKLHPLYTENRRYRFTHDSWKTSILSCMLRERKCDLNEHIAIALERDLTDDPRNHDDIEKQIRIFKHWTSSGNFVRSADIALKIGGQLMSLGLNTQGILIFDDSLAILREQKLDADEVSYGGEVPMQVATLCFELSCI